MEGMKAERTLTGSRHLLGVEVVRAVARIRLVCREHGTAFQRTRKTGGETDRLTDEHQRLLVRDGRADFELAWNAEQQQTERVRPRAQALAGTYRRVW